jgi:hypothetical protein
MIRHALFITVVSLAGCQCLEPVNEDTPDSGSDAGVDGGTRSCASSACVSTGALTHCNGTEGFSCVDDACLYECPEEGAGRVCEVNQGTYCLECGDAGTHCPLTGTTACGFSPSGAVQVEAGSCDLTELTFMRTASAQCRYLTSLPDAGLLGELWKLEDQQYAAYFPALGGWCTGRPAYTGAPRAIINCPACRFVMMGFE